LPAAREQASEGVTYAHKLDKAEAKLDWSLDAQALERKVRAFNPWPIAEAQVAGERLRIHEAVAVPSVSAEPGRVIAANKSGID
ncbi:methionyl-tRNA formyltransferase, partial [Escherichia coli]|nr:methionyl-tRNA formyltransferase [Escherichia coli]